LRAASLSADGLSKESLVIRTELTIPQLGLVAGTRALLGAGLALLLADRLSAEQRRAVGWTLVGIGAISSIPLALEIYGNRVPRHEDIDRRP
jgi:hypothetical protein